MPSFDTTSPREAYKIQGVELTIPCVFSEGHVMSDKDAAFANSRLASIMVNAYGGDMRRAVEALDKERAKLHAEGKYTGALKLGEDGEPLKVKGKTVPAPATVADLSWNHQSKLDAKFEAYKVGDTNLRVATGSNPLEKVAHTIATREVKDALAQKGWKVKPLMEAKNEEHGTEFARLVHERLNGKHKERITALAQAQIDSLGGSNDDDELNVPEALRQEPKVAA